MIFKWYAEDFGADKVEVCREKLNQMREGKEGKGWKRRGTGTGGKGKGTGTGKGPGMEMEGRRKGIAERILAKVQSERFCYFLLDHSVGI